MTTLAKPLKAGGADPSARLLSEDHPAVPHATVDEAGPATAAGKAAAPALAPAARRGCGARGAHALGGAGERAAGLAWASLRARRRAHGRPPAVVTDRGPLDGLAKFGPPPCSLAAALFAWLSRRYDLTLLLDAPPEVLAARDREHSPGELSGWQAAYRSWAGQLPSPARLDTGDRSPAMVAAEAAALAIRSWPGSRRGAPGQAKSTARSAGAARGRARQGGISSFDRPGNPRYGGRGGGAGGRLAHRAAGGGQRAVAMP